MKRAALGSLVFLVACAGRLGPATTPYAPVARDQVLSSPSTTAQPALKPWPAAWPTFHFSNMHAGLSGVKTPYRPQAFAPVWTFKTKGSTGSSSAVGAGGLIYTGSADGSLYCLNWNGTQRWKYSTGGLLSTAVTIANDGSTLYVAGGTHAYAVSSRGRLRWTFTAGLPIIGNPTLNGNGSVLYVPSFDHNLYAVDTRSGKKIWAYRTGDGIDATPTVGPNGTIYVGSYDGYFYALNPNGTLAWRFYTQFLVESTAAIEKGAQGNILFGNDLGIVFDMSPSGKLIGEAIVGAPVYASLALGPDGVGTIFGKKTALYHTLYVADWDGVLHKYAYEDFPISTVNGIPLLASLSLWTYGTTLSLFSSPAISADDHVYVGGNDGNYYEFDGDSGQVLAEFPLGAPTDVSPAIGYDGTVYIGATNGSIYAFH